MKNYRRITDTNSFGQFSESELAKVSEPFTIIYLRLKDLEDKIERGELTEKCDTEKCFYIISLKSEMEYWRTMATSLRNILEVEKFNLLKKFFEKLDNVIVNERDRITIQKIFREMIQ